MKYAAIVAWILVMIVEIVAGLRSGRSTLPLVYGLSGLIGVGCTILYFRHRASRLGRELAADVASGHVAWAAQVRETLSASRWGVSGALVVRRDASVELRPDSDSLSRGAEAQRWDAGQARIALKKRRRDISGLQYDVLELWLPNYRVRRFRAFLASGDLPDAAKASSLGG